MLRDLSEVRTLRKNLGITQANLAAKAGVSQSLIAKVEAGNTMPSYEVGRRILDTLDRMMGEREEGNTAGEVHTTPLICVSPDSTVGEALDLMRANAVSQLPVIEENSSVGSVTEKGLVSNIDSLDRSDPIPTVMEGGFPILDVDSRLELVKEMLKHYPCVITSRGGKLQGIITKADLLKGLR